MNQYQRVDFNASESLYIPPTPALPAPTQTIRSSDKSSCFLPRALRDAKIPARVIADVD